MIMIYIFCPQKIKLCEKPRTLTSIYSHYMHSCLIWKTESFNSCKHTSRHFFTRFTSFGPTASLTKDQHASWYYCRKSVICSLNRYKFSFETPVFIDVHRGVQRKSQLLPTADVTLTVSCQHEQIHRYKNLFPVGFYIPLCRSASQRGSRGKSTNGNESHKGLQVFQRQLPDPEGKTCQPSETCTLGFSSCFDFLTFQPVL